MGGVNGGNSSVSSGTQTITTISAGGSAGAISGATIGSIGTPVIGNYNFTTGNPSLYLGSGGIPAASLSTTGGAGKGYGSGGGGGGGGTNGGPGPGAGGNGSQGIVVFEW